MPYCINTAAPWEWGPAMWSFFYSLALTRNLEFKPLFFLAIDAIPCSVCRMHARAYARKNPPPVNTGERAFEYTHKFQNKVAEQSRLRRVPDILNTFARYEGVNLSASATEMLDKLKGTLPRFCKDGTGMYTVGYCKAASIKTRYSNLVSKIEECGAFGRHHR